MVIYPNPYMIIPKSPVMVDSRSVEIQLGNQAMMYCTVSPSVGVQKLWPMDVYDFMSTKRSSFRSVSPSKYSPLVPFILNVKMWWPWWLTGLYWRDMPGNSARKDRISFVLLTAPLVRSDILILWGHWELARISPILLSAWRSWFFLLLFMNLYNHR